jgi:trans-aconitate 2-methyltransferase
MGHDNSPEMQAAAVPSEGVTYVDGDLAAWDGDGRRWDVVSAQASLQWVPDHEAVLTRWTAALAAGGQLAVQVPANRDHASHVVLEEVAGDLGIDLPPDHLAAVLAPERYAEILDDLGYAHQTVRLQVFGHHLASTSVVAEWTKGTAQVRVRRATDPETYERFTEEYRRRLVARLGDRSPYFYAFKRILLVARRP